MEFIPHGNKRVARQDVPPCDPKPLDVVLFAAVAALAVRAAGTVVVRAAVAGVKNDGNHVSFQSRVEVGKSLLCRLW